MKAKNRASSNPANRMWFKVLTALAISFIFVISASKIYITKEVKENASLGEFTSYLDERIPELMDDYSKGCKGL